MPDAPIDRSEPVLETQLVAPTVLAPAAAPVLTVGGVLSRTMKVWGSHFWAFAAMSLVVYAPMIAGFGTFFAWVTRASEGRPPEPAEFVTGGAVILAGSVVTIVLSVVQMGAVTYGTIRHLHGERAPFGRMVGVGFRRGLPVVGTGFVVWFVTFAGMILLFVPGLMFLVASCVAVPAAVVERPGVFGSIGRSFDLTRGSRWPLFAAGLVIVVVIWILSTVLQFGSLLLAAVLPQAYVLAGTLVASQIGNALFSVLPVVATAVCYHDLRLQKEGVDTADLAKVFE